MASRIVWFKTDLNSVPVAELFSDLTVNGTLYYLRPFNKDITKFITFTGS